MNLLIPPNLVHNSLQILLLSYYRILMLLVAWSGIEPLIVSPFENFRYPLSATCIHNLFRKCARGFSMVTYIGKIMIKPIALPHIDLRTTQNEIHFFQKDTQTGFVEWWGIEPHTDKFLFTLLPILSQHSAIMRLLRFPSTPPHRADAGAESAPHV